MMRKNSRQPLTTTRKNSPIPCHFKGKALEQNNLICYNKSHENYFLAVILKRNSFSAKVYYVLL